MTQLTDEKKKEILEKRRMEQGLLKQIGNGLMALLIYLGLGGSVFVIMLATLLGILFIMDGIIGSFVLFLLQTAAGQPFSVVSAWALGTILQDISGGVLYAREKQTIEVQDDLSEVKKLSWMKVVGWTVFFIVSDLVCMWLLDAFVPMENADFVSRLSRGGVISNILNALLIILIDPFKVVWNTFDAINKIARKLTESKLSIETPAQEENTGQN